MKPALAPSPARADRRCRRAASRFGTSITRYFFGTAAVVALLAALVLVFLPTGIAPGARWPLVLAFAALALLAATSLRAGATRWIGPAWRWWSIAVDRGDHAWP